MILRFLLGSVTPASLRRKRSLALTASMLRPNLSRKFFCTDWSSFLRRTPLLTKMQVSCSPMASWKRTAATEESTPPERPQNDAAGADFLADGGDGFVDEALIVQSRLKPQISKTNLRGGVPSGVEDLGMKLHGVKSGARGLRRRPRRWSVGDQAEAGRE